MSKRVIIINGPMGVGKSTVGKFIAHKYKNMVNR